MPQLDPASFSSQLFWLTLSFVMLYLLMSRVLLPRVQSVLAQRARTIGNDIEDAARLKTDAEQAHDQYEKALADARSTSQALLAKTQAELRARASQRQASLDEEIEKKLAQSDAAIQSARKNALAKLEPVAGELSALIVEALVHHKPSAKEVGAVLHELAKDHTL